MTRNGKDKAQQFPEVVDALRALARRINRPVVLDGEVVALERNRPGHFQALQGRFHLKGAADIAQAAHDSPAAIFVFDILADRGASLMGEPWTTRRARLAALLRNAPPGIRLSESSPNGSRMMDRARKGGWEGVIAKRSAATYLPGARSRDWLKLKLQHRAEFVIGGYTEPRGSREYLGAILLGYIDELDAVGTARTGGGFNRESLRETYERLKALEQPESAFVVTPRTDERAHWVRPKVVVEVKFAELTSDRRLRQPIFLGVRDDKAAREVHLEKESVQRMAKRDASASGARASASRRRTTESRPRQRTSRS